jgi:hypothetical protein
MLALLETKRSQMIKMHLQINSYKLFSPHIPNNNASGHIRNEEAPLARRDHYLT